MKHSTLSSSPNSGNTIVSGILKRTIKFRAWGRYGEWEEDENLDCRKWQMIDGDSLCFEDFKPICDSLESKEDIEYFMQYTGFKDIKGKEIYEGDILSLWYSRDTTGKDIVKFNHTVAWEDTNGFSGWNIPFLESSEIIGNVFENPELAE